MKFMIKLVDFKEKTTKELFQKGIVKSKSKL